MPPPRRCSTCRHFQAAPLWRKGWCRNTLLYAPHQNHLVDERELDCKRQLGDYWEPIEDEVEAEEAAPGAAVESGAAVTSGAAAQVGLPTTVAGPTEDDPTAEDTPRNLPPVVPLTTRPTRPRPTEATEEPLPLPPRRTPPDARDRADYLRLAVPAAVILLLLGGYVAWTGFLYRAAATADPTATVAAIATVAPIASASPAATAVTPTVAPRPTAPPAPAAAPTTASAIAPPAPAAKPGATAATGGPPTLRPGGSATVETGGTQNLNMRRTPGDGVILRQIKNGERLTLLEGPRDASGQSWWRVEYGGETGWVAASFLRPAA